MQQIPPFLTKSTIFLTFNTLSCVGASQSYISFYQICVFFGSEWPFGGRLCLTEIRNSKKCFYCLCVQKFDKQGFFVSEDLNFMLHFLILPLGLLIGTTFRHHKISTQETSLNACFWFALMLWERKLKKQKSRFASLVSSYILILISDGDS